MRPQNLFYYLLNRFGEYNERFAFFILFLSVGYTIMLAIVVKGFGLKKLLIQNSEVQKVKKAPNVS